MLTVVRPVDRVKAHSAALHRDHLFLCVCVYETHVSLGRKAWHTHSQTNSRAIAAASCRSRLTHGCCWHEACAVWNRWAWESPAGCAGSAESPGCRWSSGPTWPSSCPVGPAVSPGSPRPDSHSSPSAAHSAWINRGEHKGLNISGYYRTGSPLCKLYVCWQIEPSSVTNSLNTWLGSKYNYCLL